jgi:hypothetical protein
MGYFWRYFAAEINWPKITLIFDGSCRKQRTFGGLVWPAKINPTFGGYYPQFSTVFWRSRKFKIHQKLFGPIFGGFSLVAKNSIDLFLVVFPSRQK